MSLILYKFFNMRNKGIPEYVLRNTLDEKGLKV